MSRIVKNQLKIITLDPNSEVVEYTVSNINPAISDTTVLRAAAAEINSLSRNSLSQVRVIQEVDITNDTNS